MYTKRPVVASPAVARSQSAIISSRPAAPSGRPLTRLGKDAPLFAPGELTEVWAPGTPHGTRLLKESLNADNAFMLAKPHARGAYGTVSLAQTQSGRRFLAKQVFTHASQEQAAALVNVTGFDKALQELEVHRAVPSAIDSIGAFTLGGGRSIVHLMELFDGDLSHALKRSLTSMFTPQQRHTLALEAFSRTAANLVDFHDQRYVHGDVKLDNVLLTRGGRIALADYGVTRKLNAQGQLKGRRGTPYAMAPEIMQGTGYNAQADTWALGVMAGELFVADRFLSLRDGNPFRRDTPGPQHTLPMFLFQVLSDEGKLIPQRLSRGQSDMHRFFNAWWQKSPETCRFAIEELFDLNPDHRATARRVQARAQELIAATPGHREAYAALMQKLPLASPTRAETFGKLQEAWAGWQHVQNLVQKRRAADAHSAAPPSAKRELAAAA